MFLYLHLYIHMWYPCSLEYSFLKIVRIILHVDIYISVLGLHWENFKGISAPPSFSSGVNEYYSSLVVWGRWQFPNYTPDTIYDWPSSVKQFSPSQKTDYQSEEVIWNILLNWTAKNWGYSSLWTPKMWVI